MRGKLIAFEGTDSSGKKTQIGLLEKRLRTEGRKVETGGFPTYQSTRFGELLSRYLKGELGSKEEVIPEIGSMFYAIDRYQFKDVFNRMLEGGAILLLDRYTASNVFQAAKVKGEERFVLWEWIKAVESRLPKPDATVFLNVPAELSARLFSGRDAKNPLIEKGVKDIHEADKVYQENVRLLYLEIAKRENWIIVDCCENTADGLKLRKPEEIHEEVFRRLKERIML